MIDLKNFEKIYLYRHFVDMRKCISGLSVIVQSDMKLDPFGKYMFVFCNKRKNRLKIIYWDKTGFACWFKKLEEEKFKWPIKIEYEVIQLTTIQIGWLLDGFDILKMVPHKELNYESVL